jgi:hypothetical protein
MSWLQNVQMQSFMNLLETSKSQLGKVSFMYDQRILEVSKMSRRPTIYIKLSGS